jgi:hypothetical protein
MELHKTKIQDGERWTYIDKGVEIITKDVVHKDGETTIIEKVPGMPDRYYEGHNTVYGVCKGIEKNYLHS